VPAGMSDTLSLISYNAPDATFNASDASQQTIYKLATGTFSPGQHSLTVTLPSNFYQVDFVCGAAINQLGPSGSNIFYSAEHRLISADNAGLHSDDVGEAASILFWENLGQTLIKNFNITTSTPQPKNLGNWLATNFPHLFGSQGSYNMANKNNTQVAAQFVSFYTQSNQAYAQIMATALNVYASTSGLGNTGSTLASSPSDYGFNVTTAGLGAAEFNIGNNGSAFGVANNSTLTVDQLLSYADSKISGGQLYGNNSSLIAEANAEFAAINASGGIV